MIKYIIKNIGFKILLPYIIACIIFPIVLFSYYNIQKDVETLRAYTIMFYQSFIPFLSIWNSILYWSLKLETKGNELFYIQKDNKHIKIASMFFVVFIVTIGIIFIILNTIVEDIFIEYIFILVISISFFSVAYLTSVFTGKTFIPLILSISICFINSMQIDNFNFINFEYKNLTDLWNLSIPFICISIVSLVLSFIVLKKKKILV